MISLGKNHKTAKQIAGLAGILFAQFAACITAFAQDTESLVSVVRRSDRQQNAIVMAMDEVSPEDRKNSAPGPIQSDTALDSQQSTSADETADGNLDWLNDVKVGYDGGFLIGTAEALDLQVSDYPFRLRINGWGQLRHAFKDSGGDNRDRNEFQLKRARLVFSGSAFTPDFNYFVQMDGRSSSGDNLRLLDYFLSYDVGHHKLGLDKGQFGLRTGRWKMPFHMARYLSGREFEFSDRSMSSTFFDVNRSLGWGMYGKTKRFRVPVNWEVAIFNGLVTGGAETGSSGNLDTNFAYSARTFWYPTGEWGKGQLADLDWHCELATRVGVGFANSTINEEGSTEFSSVRVVDSGERLASLLPPGADQYNVSLYAADFSAKYRGYSFSSEYYFRQIDGFQGATLPGLFDHGFWLQMGKFVVPGKLQLLGRWSRVVGDSGTLGQFDQSSDELAAGFAWYFRDQNAKLVFDATYLNGAPISSSALDIFPGDKDWLFRTQIQFAF